MFANGVGVIVVESCASTVVHHDVPNCGDSVVTSVSAYDDAEYYANEGETWCGKDCPVVPGVYTVVSHCEMSIDTAASINEDGICVVVEPAANGEHSWIDFGSFEVWG